MKFPDPKKDYPPYWRVLNRLGPEFYHRIGFNRNLSFANRFGARYRFARSVTGVTLDGYTSGTSAGYSALTKLAFTYSAFEGLLELIGIKRKDAQTVLKAYPFHKWCNEIRAFDSSCTLFCFVAGRVRPKHEKDQLLQFIKGKPCDVAALAAGLRHIFLHGELTPNALGTDPAVSCQICEYLIGVLVSVIDREIEARLKPFENFEFKRFVDPDDEDIPW